MGRYATRVAGRQCEARFLRAMQRNVSNRMAKHGAQRQVCLSADTAVGKRTNIPTPNTAELAACCVQLRIDLYFDQPQNPQEHRQSKGCQMCFVFLSNTRCTCWSSLRFSLGSQRHSGLFLFSHRLLSQNTVMGEFAMLVEHRVFVDNCCPGLLLNRWNINSSAGVTPASVDSKGPSCLTDASSFSSQESELLASLDERLLLVSDGARQALRPDGRCDVCETPVTRLKTQAIAMVQSLERAQADAPLPASHVPTYLGGSRSVAARSMPRTTPHYSSTHHR